MQFVRASVVAMFIAILGILSPNAIAQDSITIPDEIKSHVPEDSFLLVYVPSMQTLIDGISGTANAMNPQWGMMVQMMPMMMSSELFSHGTGAPVQIDMDGPIAVAVGPGAQGPMGEPAITLLIGVKGNHDGLKAKSMPNARVTTISGSSMVQVTTAPEGAKWGAGDNLLKNIPAGEISIAFDQASFVKSYGPMIEMMLSMAGGGMNMGQDKNMDPQAKLMQAQMERTVQQVKMFMGMFQSWDCAMTFDGPSLATTIRWVPTDSSLNASGSSELGSYTEVMLDESPLGMVMSKSAMEQWMLMDMEFDQMGFPKNLADAISKFYADAKSMSKEISSPVGMSMGIDDKGIWMLQHFKVSDRQTYLADVNKTLEALASSGIGVSVSNLKMLDDGVGYTLRLNVEELFGMLGYSNMIPEHEMGVITSVVNAAMGGEVGLQLRYLYVDDGVAVVLGRNGHAIGRAKQILKNTSGENANILNTLVASADGSPTMAMSMDMRNLITDVLGFLHSVPALKGEMGEVPKSAPAGDPVRMDATCTAMTNGGQCVLVLDVGGFVKMMEAMDHEVQAKKQQQAAMAN